MLPNKATFRIGGGGNKDKSLTKVHYNPGVNAQYIHDMLGSQKNSPSKTVSEAEEELMMNRIFNADYRDYRNRR